MLSQRWPRDAPYIWMPWKNVYLCWLTDRRDRAMHRTSQNRRGCIIFTARCTLVTCHCQLVKSSQVECDQVDGGRLAWGHFSLKSGHVSVPQRLAGLWLTPTIQSNLYCKNTAKRTWAIWCNGNTPKIRVEQGWGHSGAQNTCNISETVQDKTKVTITD